MNGAPAPGAKPASIDDYLGALPPLARDTLAAVRALIMAAAPTAIEGISYEMPTFKYQGRPLISFAAWKSHWAIYGHRYVDQDSDLLAGLDTSRGTIRFAPGVLPPDGLIGALIEARTAEIDAALAARRAKTKAKATSRTTGI